MKKFSIFLRQFKFFSKIESAKSIIRSQLSSLRMDTTIVHSSKSVEYAPSYNHLNFTIAQSRYTTSNWNFLKINFWWVDQKFRKVFARVDNITAWVFVPREFDSHAGCTFFSRLIFFEVNNQLNLKRLQLQILLVFAREPSQYYVF